MAILITGGTGFIGLHTVRAFLDAGHDVVSTQYRVLREPAFVRDALGSTLHREVLDVTSPYAMHDLMRKYTIDGIVHLAVPGYRALSPSEDFRNVMLGMLNVLDTALSFNVKRTLIASSIGAYAGIDGAYVEDTPVPVASSNPTTAFKKAEEILGLHFADRTKMDLVFARIGVIYGPLYHSMANAPSRMLHRAVRGDANVKIDDIVPAQRRDFCYVKDCAQGLLRLQTSQLRQRVYNVGSGRATSHAEVADAVRAAVPGAKLELTATGPERTETDQAMELSAIARDTGYKPAFDIRSAIADYAAWLKENPY